MARKRLKETKENASGKQTQLAELKLEASFAHNEKTYFMLFHIVHIIKNRNVLLKKAMIFVSLN